MLFLVEKHCSTCAIRLNYEMKSMPSSAQTRSTEPHAGVLKHEKEELMDISSPQQDMNDMDNVTVSSLEKYTLVVVINVALLSILHETAVKYRHLGLSTKKSGNKGLKKQNRN